MQYPSIRSKLRSFIRIHYIYMPICLDLYLRVTLHTHARAHTRTHLHTHTHTPTHTHTHIHIHTRAQARVYIHMHACFKAAVELARLKCLTKACIESALYIIIWSSVY